MDLNQGSFYHSNHLDLNISNKKTLRDNTKTINQYLKDVKQTNSLLNSNKYLFNQTKQNKLNMGDKEVQ